MYGKKCKLFSKKEKNTLHSGKTSCILTSAVTLIAVKLSLIHIYVPSKGYRTFLLEEGEEKCEDHIQVSESHMENAFFSIDLNEKGQFISIYDKRAARELLPEGKAANRCV